MRRLFGHGNEGAIGDDFGGRQKSGYGEKLVRLYKNERMQFRASRRLSIRGVIIDSPALSCERVYAKL